VQCWWIPSLKLLPKSLKLKSRERASVIAQKPKLAAAMPLGRLWSRMLRMLSAGAHRQFPLILRLVAIAMTLTTDNCGSKLRAPDKPHEQLADRVPLADPNGPAHAARRPTACSALKLRLWWSAEMDRLTYSEWQLEAPCRLGGWFRLGLAVGTRIEDIDQHDDASSAAAAGQLLISSSLRRRQQPEP
jgi:hypothetical protein